MSFLSPTLPLPLSFLPILQQWYRDDSQYVPYDRYGCINAGKQREVDNGFDHNSEYPVRNGQQVAEN